MKSEMSQSKMEGHRITIILDDDIVKKLRKRQAKLLMGATRSVTLTSVIKEALNEYLKKDKD
jgi:hypothetical protein